MPDLQSYSRTLLPIIFGSSKVSVETMPSISLANRTIALAQLHCESTEQPTNFMDKFVIRGGNPLVGTVRISGAKNSALPCMAAAILTEEEVTLENIPQVRDIETERKLLVAMGAEVELGTGTADHRTRINFRTLSSP